MTFSLTHRHRQGHHRRQGRRHHRRFQSVNKEAVIVYTFIGSNVKQSVNFLPHLILIM